MKSIPLALLVANEPRRLERLGNSTLKELSINKIALSFVFAEILGATVAVAETDGAFVGLQAGYGANKLKMEPTASIALQLPQALSVAFWAVTSSFSRKALGLGITAW